MSVQKITSVAQKNKSLKQNVGINSNFLKGISFKGYSKDVVTHNGYIHPDPYGTSGGMGVYSKVTEQDIEHSSDTIIVQGEKPYESQNIDAARARVYYADAGETITDEILKSHAYIVKYKDLSEPIPMEDVEKADKVSILKQLIEKLEQRARLIELYKNKRKQDLKTAHERFENAKVALENAKIDFEQIEVQHKQNQEVLTYANDKFKKLKKAEEDEYKIAQARKQLETLNDQLDGIDGGIDSGLDVIKQQVQEYLKSLKG